MQLSLQLNQKTLLVLNLRFAILVLCLGLIPTSCKSVKKDPRESWSPTIYAGSSSTKSVQRAQSGEQISCESKQFDEMFCTFDRDLRKLFEKCMEKKEADQAWSWFRGERSEEEKKANVPATEIDRKNKPEASPQPSVGGGGN